MTAPTSNVQPDPRVVAALEGLGADFEILPCEPHLADTAAFCQAYGIPPHQSANTIVVASRRPTGIAVACVLLATHRLDVNGEVRRRLGVKKASFAPPDETAELTGMEMGGVTPFGLPAAMKVWVDAAVMDPDWIVLGAGTRSAKIRVAPAVLVELSQVRVVEDLARPLVG
ncbi:MAG TPA: YbaK/EbsC family protein [Acidimicrobiia bacterium]|nr:YbaK/EbsC family protein [Acidimicrobiia bacterium]